MNADLTEIRIKVRALLRGRRYLTTEDAEDAEQDTMMALALYTDLQQERLTSQRLEELLKLGSTVAKRRAVDHVRSKTRTPIGAAVTGVLGPQADGERAGEERICADVFGQKTGLVADEVERREMCAFLLSSMSADERTLITLDYRGYSYGEIASTLNISSNTVKSRLHELRRKSERWKQEWDKEWDGGAETIGR